jgi:hypothetical protein
MLTSYRKLKNLYKLNEMLGSGGLKGHGTVELGRAHDLIDAAQRLHASVYLGRGFISPEDVGNDGKLHLDADSHQIHAHYFAITLQKGGEKEVVATVRHIESFQDKGLNSFPLVNKVELYEWAQEELNGVSPEKTVEISGLAKKRGTPSAAILLLYREMWYRSLRDGHSIWLMACDTNLYKRLELLFAGAILQIGDRASYQGGDVIPALCRPYEVLPSLLRTIQRSRLQKKAFRRKILEFLLTDYPPHLISAEERAMLKKLKVGPYA